MSISSVVFPPFVYGRYFWLSLISPRYTFYEADLSRESRVLAPLDPPFSPLAPDLAMENYREQYLLAFASDSRTSADWSMTCDLMRTLLFERIPGAWYARAVAVFPRSVKQLSLVATGDNYDATWRSCELWQWTTRLLLIALLYRTSVTLI